MTTKVATRKVVPDPGSGGADVWTWLATNLVAEPKDRGESCQHEHSGYYNT